LAEYKDLKELNHDLGDFLGNFTTIEMPDTLEEKIKLLSQYVNQLKLVNYYKRYGLAIDEDVDDENHPDMYGIPMTGRLHKLLHYCSEKTP
jgi:hypothetical protein